MISCFRSPEVGVARRLELAGLKSESAPGGRWEEWAADFRNSDELEHNGRKPAFITYDYHESTSAGRAACIPHAAARGSARQGAAALSELGWQGGRRKVSCHP